MKAVGDPNFQCHIRISQLCSVSDVILEKTSWCLFVNGEGGGESLRSGRKICPCLMPVGSASICTKHQQ